MGINFLQTKESVERAIPVNWLEECLTTLEYMYGDYSLLRLLWDFRSDLPKAIFIDGFLSGYDFAMEQEKPTPEDKKEG